MATCPPQHEAAWVPLKIPSERAHSVNSLIGGAFARSRRTVEQLLLSGEVG